MSRPSVAPSVLAELTAAVPARITKRLDASPRVADTWAWTAGARLTIAAGDETVTLPLDAVRRREDATCTCLLQPRCFHLLAVLAVLPLAGEKAGAQAAEVPSAAADTHEDAPPLSHAERASAEAATRIAAAILHDGLTQVSTLRMGELLRVAHACRRDGLFRLEAAALGVFEAARDLRGRSQNFHLAGAAAALAELLLVSARLADLGDRGERLSEWRGVGRRTYRARGALRLAGVACAPVVTRGYAGVVTYFTDGEQVFSAQEVVPGDEERALHAYDAQLRFGEVSLSHRDAARGGLLFANARVSDDGRLGAGKDVTCVATAGSPELVLGLFGAPLREELARAERSERPALLFLEGSVQGAVDQGARLELTSGGALPIALPIDDPRFPYRENLALLAEARARVHFVGRLPRDGAALEPVAVALDGARWLSLGYDRLARRDLPVIPGEEVARVEHAPATVLEPLRRRLLRFALAGTRSLPGAAQPEVEREARDLRAAMLPLGADTLRQLAVGGRGAEATARAWLALHVYLRTAEAALARARWGLPE